MIFLFICRKLTENKRNMYFSELTIRVRYGETDRMGFVYYGNYAQYFEVARVEALRALGITYKQLEDEGILLPVYSYSIQFHQPAYYDDNLVIKTCIKELPKASIHFKYETFNEANERLNQAETTLVFLDASTRRPCRPPASLLDRLSSHFK